VMIVWGDSMGDIISIALPVVVNPVQVGVG
jgi:hypothetical protein